MDVKLGPSSSGQNMDWGVWERGAEENIRNWEERREREMKIYILHQVLLG
jgi:hypothetical protein